MENLNAIKPLQDFNWDEFEQGEVFGTGSRQEQEAAYESTLSKVKNQEVVVGTVTSINKREVTVNIGFKSEGTISASEFRYNPELQVGDKVEVFIESQEDKKGQLVLSHRQARIARSWDRINEALEKDEVVRGYVKS
ncbi:MAG: S1 RNA-binding domain-containing protein, partial [Porphyromonadaceae bacterium]|nr:S1 RNA-binding domain-containing protein [Porphyromonadaceae bacterium]